MYIYVYDCIRLFIVNCSLLMVKNLNKMPNFSFENLEVYQKAVSFTKGTSRSSKDFSRFIDMARGSCFECAALIVIAGAQGLVNQSVKTELTDELVLLSKMLSGLKKSINHKL